MLLHTFKTQLEPDPDYILRTPHRSDYVPDNDTRGRIGTYLVQVLGGRRNELVLHLPRVMPLWGKMRIHGGDLMRTMFALRRVKNLSRDNSFVRVCVIHWYLPDVLTNCYLHSTRSLMRWMTSLHQWSPVMAGSTRY